MKLFNTRLKKVLLTSVSIAGIAVVLVILFISPIAKYVIEKYSVKWTGRQIKMDWAYVNPFTGYAHFSNLKIYEAKSDSVFISAGGISIGVNLHKLLSKEYEITSITLDKPVGIAIQEARNAFNFSDIIERFSTHPSDTALPAKPAAHFNILHIKINDGIFYLRDTLIHINYFIKDFNFESTGKRWNADTFPGTFSFSPGIGTGHINGNFTINTNNLDYRFAFIMRNLNLSILEQYLKDITNYGTFSAYLDANLMAAGNFTNGQNIDAKGRIEINDFHFGKKPGEDYLSFDTLTLGINEINPEKHFYNLDSLILSHPYFKYEKYDYLDNMETMFGQNGNKVAAENTNPAKFNLILSLGHFFATISRNFFESAYKINKLGVKQADIKFNDYSPSEKFSIAANPLYITADSINKNQGSVKISLHSGIQPYGNMSVMANINPRDSANFDLNYQFNKIPITIFNPYLISYTSFPLTDGTIEFNGVWKVRKGILQSENHLLIIDPHVASRLKNKADRWIPMWLVMFFARDRGDVIDYQIPITGNLKSPTFHLHDVVFTALKNIFVKPATTPYIFKERALENDIDKSLMLKWGMHQVSMTALQERFIEKMAEFLSKNPSASVVISPQQYQSKEKEYILFFEAKKKYYLSQHPEKAHAFGKSDSEQVDKMSVKDSSFVHYLNKHLTRTLVFTIQDKCTDLIDTNIVNEQFNLLNKSRKNAFISYFKEKGVADKVTFNPAKNTIPYNGFSCYRIDYKGKLPDYLIEAYKKMEVLNNEAPREKYKKERKKTRSI